MGLEITLQPVKRKLFHRLYQEFVLEKAGFRQAGEDDAFRRYRCERGGPHAGSDH